MSNTPEVEQQADSAKQMRDKLKAIVGEQVMHQLGEPADLLQVQVRPLWDLFYRRQRLWRDQFWICHDRQQLLREDGSRQRDCRGNP